MKQTFKEANYKFIRKVAEGEYLVRNLETNQKELFVANKNHASWGLKYKNTHLEFVRSVSEKEVF